MLKNNGFHNRHSPILRAFSPLSLFSGGAPGAWYDPSDYATLFQDSAGTTPVTAVEQPVGLMLDKSQGLVLGSERKADFVTDIVGTATAATYNTTTGVGSLTRVDASNQSYVTLGSLSSGFYKATISCQTGSIIVRAGAVTGTQQAALSAGQTLDVYVNTVNRISISHTTSAGSSTFTVVSVKELPGNHAFQATSASRPVLSARYNLLTKTEQFNDAAWSKTGTTATTGLISETATTGEHNVIQVPSSGNVFTVEVKEGGRDYIRLFSGTSTGTSAVTYRFSTNTFTSIGSEITATSEVLSDGYVRIGIFSSVTRTQVRIMLLEGSGTTSYAGDITKGVFARKASFVPANQSTLPYQRVNTATDYNTTGFLPYLKFDGVDDSLSTNSISFTSTDKMSVFAGVRKLSDAAGGMLAELSASASTNNGSFYVSAPESTSNYGVRARGATGTGGYSPTTFTAPITNVVAAQLDLSPATVAAAVIPRINGAVNQTNIANVLPGGGNFGNYPLYIGRRNNATSPFNGQMYSMIIVGKAVTAGELSSTETYVNQKTGAY